MFLINFLKNRENIVLTLLVVAFLVFNMFGAKYGVLIVFLSLIFYVFSDCFYDLNILKEIKPLKWWIIFNGGIILMALCSLLFASNVFSTLTAIFSFEIIPLLLTCFFYLVFKVFPKKKTKKVFQIMICLLFLNALTVILKHFLTGDSRSVGIGNHPIIPYVIVLLMFLSISISMMMYGRFKILALFLIIVGILALYANGTRASILSVGSMFVIAIIYPKYRYKRLSVSLILALFACLVFEVYQWSGRQTERFNFKSMIEKVGVVWSYAPAEMGRFDKGCFAPLSFYKCSFYSGDGLDDRFSFESSALYRLSLNKSALYAISSNIWRPNGYYALHYDVNLPKDIDSLAIPYLESYTHIQNGFLSAFFEMGLIGGIMYLCCFVFLFLYGLKKQNCFGFTLSLLVVGVSVQNLFDVPFAYGGVSSMFFSFIGALIGMTERKHENFI